MKPKAVVSPKKIEEVDKLVSSIDKYNVIGIVDLTNLSAEQLAKMRDKLRKDVNIKVAKKHLLRIALEKSSNKKKGVENLVSLIRGSPALLLSNSNPFKLASIINRSKTKTAAKPGQIAPNDIKVNAGPTSFAPGPILGELGAVGIKAGVDGGKVAIKEDSIVVREGQVIKADVAGILARLGIEPMEVGLNLLAVYENGLVFDKKVLLVDEKEYLGKIKIAYTSAFNLAFNSGYPTKANIKMLVGKAYKDATGLAESQNIVTKSTVGAILGKAHRIASSLSEKLA